MSHTGHQDIRIGTLVRYETSPETIPQLISLGFESFSLVFGKGFTNVDLPSLADKLHRILDGTGACISSLSVYGNPMGDNETAKIVLQSWIELINHAPGFNCNIVGGFTGRIPDKSIEQNIEPFVETFSPLAELADKNKVKLAFENCSMGGNWEKGRDNIAIGPEAWDLMFNSLQAANCGLQWEPCHQMIQLIDPLPQIETWHDRIFHIHGKDATIRRDKLSRFGILGKQQFSWHRTPGFGDSNWTDIISELRRNGFRGSIDIEGNHDPVYKDDLEITGQCRALHYLKQCRGGQYIQLQN